MKTRLLSGVALIVVLLLALAVWGVSGCGNPDSGGSGETSSTSVSSGAPGAKDTGATVAAGGSSSTAGSSQTGNQGTTTTVPKGESGVLEIKGLVTEPKKLTVADVQKMKVVTVKVKDVSGKETEYQGVSLKEFFKQVGVQKEASRVAMTAHANGYTVELPLQDILWSADSLLAISSEGTLDVVIPDFDRKAWVKDVVMMEFK